MLHRAWDVTVGGDDAAKVVLGARGTSSWTLRVKARLPHGGYRIRARGNDVARNGEQASHANTIRVRV